MSLEYYRIQRGHPIPPAKVGRPPNMPMASMQIGDSFLVPQRVNVRNYNKDGKHYVLRAVTEEGIDAFRVWRVT